MQSNITSDKSKIVIASNTCYDLCYDPAKNRIYLSIRGFWKSLDNVPHYLDDWQKVLRLKKPGFTVLSNLQEMITHPQNLNFLHVQAQQMVMEQQVASIAHVIPADKIAKLQVEAIAEQSKIPVRNFDSKHQAELWLDKQSNR